METNSQLEKQQGARILQDMLLFATIILSKKRAGDSSCLVINPMLSQQMEKSPAGLCVPPPQVCWVIEVSQPTSVLPGYAGKINIRISGIE